MQQSSHFVSSFNITIELVVNGSVGFHEALKTEQFWNEFIPKFSYSSTATPSEIWHITESKTLTFDIAAKEIQLPASAMKLSIVIIEATFEYLRQQKGLYTMHGSVIIRNNKAVAFIGNLSGIGKTTLASYASTHGWSWVGDEKFTLSGSNVVGTTQGILNDDKTRLAASQTLPNALNQEYPLVLFCQPIVTTEAALVRSDISAEKSLWILYDEMTRDIRQVDGVISTSLPVLQSYDTADLAAQRLQIATVLTETVQAVFLRGPKQLILSEIEAITS